MSYLSPAFLHGKRAYFFTKRIEIAMTKIDSLVQDFLAQKKIAVVGVSDKPDTRSNLNYKKFKDAGYQD